MPAVLKRLAAAAGVKDVRRSLDSRSCFSLGAGLFASTHFDVDQKKIVHNPQGDTEGKKEEGAEASSSSSSSSSSSLHDLVILDPNVPDFFDEADLELEDKIVADAQEREAKMWERDEVSRGEPSH